jgi:hypothetical protein
MAEYLAVFGRVSSGGVGLFFGLLGGVLFTPLHQASRSSRYNRMQVGLVFGLFIGILFGAVVGLLMWLVAGLNALEDENLYTLSDVLLTAFHYGLMGGIFIGVTGRLILGSTSQLEVHFEPMRMLIWLWKNVWQRLSKSEALVHVIIIGLIFGTFQGIKSGRQYGLPVSGTAHCYYRRIVAGRNLVPSSLSTTLLASMLNDPVDD